MVIRFMLNETLTWIEIKAAAASMFNIMGNGKEVIFAQNVWQKLSELGLTSYSNNFEQVKIKILFIAFGDLYKDLCIVAYGKHTTVNYDDLLKQLNIDEFTLGRFYQEIIKPKENKLPADFNASNALEEFSKFFRKDIFQLLLTVYHSGRMLFVALWRTTYPDSDEDNLKDYEVPFYNLTPAKSKAYNWVESGCYVLLEDKEKI